MKVTKKTRLLAPPGPFITKVSNATPGAPSGQISARAILCRMDVRNMPGVEEIENDLKVVWTKPDGTNVTKDKSHIDLTCIASGYVMPEPTEGIAAGDRLKVKAVFNGVDTNVKNVLVV